MSSAFGAVIKIALTCANVGPVGFEPTTYGLEDPGKGVG